MKSTTQGVHPAGRAGFAFLNQGKVVTCGQDGSVRIVSIDPLADSGIVCLEDGTRQFVRIATNPVDRKVFALAKEDDGFNAFVQLYALESLESTNCEGKDRVTQTSLGICDLEWSPNGEWLIAATDSDGVRAMKVTDPVNSIKTLRDHEGGVKGIAFDPKGEFLATVGADGSLRIYSTSSWTCVKHKARFCERDSEGGSTTYSDCKPSWSADGQMLAVPGAGTIRVLTRGDWDEEIEFEQAVFPSFVTLTAFSRFHLAACCGGEQAKLIVWSLVKKSVLYSFESFDRLFFRSLGFFQKDLTCDLLVGMNSDGELTKYDLPLTTDMMQSNPSSAPIETFEQTHSSQMSQIDESQPVMSQDEPRLNVVSTNAENEDDFPVEESLLKIKEGLGFDEDAQPLLRNRPAGDLAASRALFEQQNGQTEEEIADIRTNVDIIRRIVDKLRPPASHEPFQPGATHFGSSFDQSNKDGDDDGPQEDRGEDVDRRFLAWNHVGTIVCRKDSDKQSIEIDFADTSAHRPVRIPDFNFFDKAALAETGAFFSSTASNGANNDNDDDGDANMNGEEQPREGILFYRAFADPPWNYHWTFTLPKREQIVSLACGNTFCCAATKKGFLRVFRPSGLQEPISVVPGPVLAMSASGSMLLVLHHTSHRRIDHELAFQLLEFGNEGDSADTVGRIVASGPLPCDQGVLWCGFADESLGFMPLVYRKDAVLLGLSPRAEWTWTVLSDGTGLDKGTKLWPIAASREGGLLAVALRHRRKQPGVVPRSTPALFAIKIPILRDKTKKQQGIKYDEEEKALSTSLVLVQRRWAHIDSDEELTKAEAIADLAVLRAMVVSIKLKEYSRAFGLACRLRLPKSLEVALEKAQDANADQSFQERLVALIDERAAQQQEDIQQQQEQEADDDARSVQNFKGMTGMRVSFEDTPQRKKTRLDNDDVGEQSSPFITKNKKPAMVNPYSKGTPSPATKKLLQRTSPIRIPELSRQASFTVEAMSDHKRKL